MKNVLAHRLILTTEWEQWWELYFVSDVKGYKKTSLEFTVSFSSFIYVARVYYEWKWYRRILFSLLASKQFR